ncbi:MAG: bifunctional methionine sulfoxide reductase B/A protein [Candidatus Staskawiczbacteria bacterium]|nr:bifunctional methionine sulfoxide reductase B/A protein [Candidatus Staskawiczbacteria bacterium]
MKFRKLTKEEEKIIVHKGTEPPFGGKFNEHFEKGTYVCRRCGEPLFSSESKFHSDCGWPSFDDEIPGAIKRLPDKDGIRTEIICQKCNAHLGHVFSGENLTPKNTRLCVNSVSLDFISKKEEVKEEAVFGAGCFWCAEAIFSRLKGVVSAVSGYAGGEKQNPRYEEVSSGNTGHAEVVKIIYDPQIIQYGSLLDVFFHTHNPTEKNMQGNDIGTQYRSIILYANDGQKKEALKFINELEKSKEFTRPIVTELKPLKNFYEAEDYHQKYYSKNPRKPYCQAVINPKIDKFIKRYEKLLK